MPDKNIGIDDDDNRPIFHSVQCCDSTIVAAATLKNRMALAFFNIKRFEMPLLVCEIIQHFLILN